MNGSHARRIFLFFAALFLFSTSVRAKPPVIVIPGLVGSELVNEKTGELVWFKTARSKTDDLRLPILSADLSADRDDLIARDVLRRLNVGGLASVDSPYQNLIESLKTNGYAEGAWEKPVSTGAENTFYVFAYDWRRDNVESARILIGKIERLKAKLNRPDLRFNVVAHSMGGLVARYAAMYADADLPVEKPASPTWAGAKHFDKIFLLGTPNDGSMLALRTLAGGVSPFNLSVNLPFVQNFTRFDFFTIPSVYQLLPAGENLRAFDENLKPIAIDVYDARDWDKYGWSATGDKNFAKNFSRAEQQNARVFFESALNRARRFHEALRAASAEKNAPVSIYAVGAECRKTLAAVIVRRSGGGWKTLFKPQSFRREADGETVSADALTRLMLAPGDGVVTKNSLLAAASDAQFFQCEGHNYLVSNRAVQTNLFSLLAK